MVDNSRLLSEICSAFPQLPQVTEVMVEHGQFSSQESFEQGSKLIGMTWKGIRRLSDEQLAEAILWVTPEVLKVILPACLYKAVTLRGVVSSSDDNSEVPELIFNLATRLTPRDKEPISRNGYQPSFEFARMNRNDQYFNALVQNIAREEARVIVRVLEAIANTWEQYDGRNDVSIQSPIRYTLDVFWSDYGRDAK